MVTVAFYGDIAPEVEVANTDRPRDIVAEVGWPGRALVGERAAEHAWLIAQHADHQLDSQRIFLVSCGVPSRPAMRRRGTSRI